MRKHTAGKWKAIESGDGKESVVYGKSNHLHEPVCVIPHDDVTEEGGKEVRANVRLILAAPDLLAVAMKAMDLYAFGVGAMSGDKANQDRCIEKAKILRDQFEAAVAKAVGRSS